MKVLNFLLCIFCIQVTFGQVNMYKSPNGKMINEQELKLSYEEISKNLKEYYVVPTVYHKVEKNDTIINYYSFYMYRTDSTGNKGKFEIKFKQDSLFLLLNKKLPEFTLKDMDGNEFSSSQLIGKPTLLNYWSIYCGPCVAEIPALNMVKEKYSDKMNFIALTESTCLDAKFRDFLNEHPFKFHILQNADAYKKILKINAIPKNIFVDADGYVREIQGNYPYQNFDPEKGITENYFTKIIEELIQK